MVEIQCAGESLQLLRDKAVFWPAPRTLILADLHLGKSAAFRKAGLAVPETTTGADLERLRLLLRATQSRHLIILGDLFHSRDGLQPVMLDQVKAWRTGLSDVEIVLVPGNHDRKAGPPPSEWNFQVVAGTWNSGPFLFSHEPREAKHAYVLAGHLHPAMVLRDEYGPSIRAACF
jgi:DNA ligase-associated metallophosphoesterase